VPGRCTSSANLDPGFMGDADYQRLFSSIVNLPMAGS
jgi:hypothetical protein